MSIFNKIKEHFNKKNQSAYFDGFKKTDEKFGVAAANHIFSNH